MLTPGKITEIFCIADDFCKEFAQEVCVFHIVFLYIYIKSLYIYPFINNI